MSWGVHDARAQWVTRRTLIAPGGITFVGNTLGLSKLLNANAPGTEHSIGAFVTVDTTLQDGTYPLGTTNDWRLDSASAILALPPGSTVIYAELVWAGSYSYGGEDVIAFENDPVTFTTPVGASSVSPDPVTAKSRGTGSGGACATLPCMYVRSAEVTALVQAGGSGTYTVGSVPGTQGDTDNSQNAAGWTLAVIYGDPTLPTRDLTLFVGAETAGAPEAAASGFCTPPTGPVAGRLAVSTVEGDSVLTGDTMRFGPTAPLGLADRVLGPNNPLTNFFDSQINGDDGLLVTTGTFGTRNHIPGSNIVGGRQGWDITQIDVSSRLANAQTTAFAQATTTGDTFVVSTLGLAIDVGAPRFALNAKSVDKLATVVGDTLTYTIVLDNSAGSADATGLVFTDPPPAGTTFVAGSFRIDGVVQPGADPAAGVLVGTVVQGTTRTVTFQVQVTAIPAAPATAQYANGSGWTYQFTSCAGQPTQNGAVTSNVVTTGVPRIDATKTVAPLAALPLQTLTYDVVVTNDGTVPATGVTLTDAIPAGTTYVPGSTTLNGAAVPDVAGAMPFATGGLVSSPAAPAGQIDVGTSAAVRFQVVVNLGASGSVTNTALIDPDGPGGLPPFARQAITSLLPSADLAVTKTGPASVPSGAGVVYTVTVTNNGPAAATGVVLTDTLPPEVTLVGAMPAQGSCSGTTAITCTLGMIAPGASVPVTITTRALPSANGTFTNVATVAGTTPDPNPVNDTAMTDTTAIPTADLAVSKTGTPDPVGVGSPLTYTIAVTNQGPGDATGVTVTDTLPAAVGPATFTASQGTCAITAGTLACTLGALAAGGSATLVVDTTRTATGAFSNTAVVTGNEADPDLTNNSSTANTAALATESCGNCVDDDGDGLVDLDDPDCCPQVGTLEVTSANVRPRKRPRGMLRLKLKAQLGGPGLEVVDPLHTDVLVALADSGGPLLCCTLGSEHWMRLFKQHYGFWDDHAQLCPPLNDMGLTSRTDGARMSILIRHLARFTPPDLRVAVRIGQACAAGSASLRSTPGGGATFP